MSNSRQSGHIFFVDFLRFIACALITNSHLDGVYPLDISWGGCPGNCLFFMISGFLLVNSVSNEKSILKWYVPKIIRLYIPLFLVNILIIAVGYREPYLGLFLFPIRQFRFIPVIVILYLIFYLSMRSKTLGRIFLIIDGTAYIITYFFLFDRSDFFVERHFYFLIMYGFFAMMIGAYIRNNIEKVNKLPFIRSDLLLIAAFINVVGFLGMKLWIATNSNMALQLQFLTQLFSIVFSAGLFLAMHLFEDKLKKFMQNNLLGKIIKIIGISTFEIYLIQYVLIYNLKDLVFPVNLLLIILSVVFSGYILHIICEDVCKKAVEVWYD